MAKNSKLKLNKETIARLEEDSMRNVKGGIAFSIYQCTYHCNNETATKYCLSFFCKTMAQCDTIVACNSRHVCNTDLCDTHKNSVGCPK